MTPSASKTSGTRGSRRPRRPGLARHVPDLAMSGAYRDSAERLGRTVAPVAPNLRAGSTGMGNVSHLAPTIHPTIGHDYRRHDDAPPRLHAARHHRPRLPRRTTRHGLDRQHPGHRPRSPHPPPGPPSGPRPYLTHRTGRPVGQITRRFLPTHPIRRRGATKRRGRQVVVSALTESGVVRVLVQVVTGRLGETGAICRSVGVRSTTVPWN